MCRFAFSEILRSVARLLSNEEWPEESPRPLGMKNRRARRPTTETLEPRWMLAGSMQIGMNLETVVDWSPAWTFTDAFQSSRPWISHAYNTATFSESWEGGGTVHVDNKGWPTQLNQWTNAQGQLMRQRLGTLMFRDIGTAYPAGTYRAEWEGTGQLSWGFAAKLVEQGTMADGRHYALLNVTPSSDGIYLRIEDLNSSDPIRNIHVWMPDHNGQSFAGKVWKPGAAFSPFHPQFLDRLAPFRTLRFMDWAETNSSDTVTWSHRRPFDYATQQSGDFRNGVAVEYMVQLANELDADVWLNMPYRADDNFVRSFATQVRDTLETGRRIYIEWSNETWNAGWGFETYPWVTQELAQPENAYLNGDRWAFVARETKRDFDIWSDVFAGQTDRMVRVVAGQQANSWIAQQIAVNMGGHFDAISSAAYAYVSDTDRTSFGSTTTSDQVIDALIRNLPTTFSWLQQHRNLADQFSASLGRPIRFVAYEGGPHLDSWGNAYEPAFFAAGNSARMYDVYTQLLAGSQQAGLEMFGNFNFTGGLYPSSFGVYGSLQSMTQSSLNAPKYRALYDAATQGGRPEVSITAIASTASETGPATGQWRVQRSGLTETPLVVNLSVSGTASAADHTGLPVSLSFLAGETTKLVTMTPVDDSLVEGTEQLTITLLAGSGYTVKTSHASATISIADNDVVIQYGLLGTYYDNQDFTAPRLTRMDPQVSFNWGSRSPAQQIGKDTFSIRWNGQLQAIGAGNYRFRTYSDDGVRVLINGQTVIDNWTVHRATYNTSGLISLKAGQLVDIQVDYFENSGSAVMRLEWQRPGQTAFAVIPKTQFRAPRPIPVRPVSTPTSNILSALMSATTSTELPSGAATSAVVTSGLRHRAAPSVSPISGLIKDIAQGDWNKQADQFWTIARIDDEFWFNEGQLLGRR
ncbi:MAG: PA14 domain-containing protein [Planctomycetota bacterium]